MSVAKESNIDSEHTNEEIWAVLVRIEDKVARIDETVRDVQISSAKVCGQYDMVTKKVDEHNGLKDRVTKLESSSKVAAWIIGVISTVIVGSVFSLVWAVLTHTATITWP